MPKGKLDVQRQIPELSAAGIFRKRKQRLNSDNFNCDGFPICVIAAASRCLIICLESADERTAARVWWASGTHTWRDSGNAWAWESAWLFTWISFFVWLKQTDRVHTSVYVFALYMQMHVSVHWCMQMCVSSRGTARQYGGGGSHQTENMLSRGQNTIETPVTPLCSAVTMTLTNPLPPLFPSSPGFRLQTELCQTPDTLL